jgi:hypothetical protein
MYPFGALSGKTSDFIPEEVCMKRKLKPKTESETNPKDLKTTITIVQLILKALQWWKEYRDKKKAAKDVG